MSKKDCSELAKAILDLAMNLSADPDIRNVDEVIGAIQKSFPVMPRNEIVRAVVDATTNEKREADEFTQKWNRIKREFRQDESFREKAAKFDEMLEKGETPEPAEPRPLGPDTIEQYRKTAANLRKWVKTSDPAMQRNLEDRLKNLDEQIESGNFDMDRKQEARLHDSLQEIQDQIKIASQKIRDAKTAKKIMDQIDAFRKHLEEGTLPPKKERPPQRVGPMDALREIRDDLKKQLANSVQGQKEKLEESIRVLNDKIKSGDFMPKTRPDNWPDDKELRKLIYERDRLRSDIRIAIYKLKPKTIWSRPVSVLNAARAVMTSYDLSAVFRQGGMLTLAHPIKAAKAIPDMINALLSAQTANDINNDILARDNAPLYSKAGLYISPTDESGKLVVMEEPYMSRLVSAIPGVGASQRAYVTFLNLLRADMFDAMAACCPKLGEPTLEEAKAIATYINEATGRGSFGSFERAAVGLNVVFFAPKYVTSRFQLLLGHPLWRSPNSVRKLVAMEYARFLTGVGCVLTLGMAAGGDIEWDPRSSDFLKIRFGNTRLDPLAGFSQVATLIARVATGSMKSATTGEVKPIRGEDVPYGGMDVASSIGSFLRKKLSPTFGIPLDILAGEDVVGEPADPVNAVVGSFVPLSIGELLDAMKEQGVPEGMALGVLGIFGMSVQTYEPKKKKSPRRKTQ